jgi:hypothetical protein
MAATMQIEDYRRTTTVPDASATDVSAERKTLLESAGMTKLLQRESERQPKLALAALVYEQELSVKELATWMEFLPTCYSPQSYSFDSPDDDVIGAIAFATELGCFDRIEIWTPEGGSLKERLSFNRNGFRRAMSSFLDNLIDPMAVGVISGSDGTQHYFPIIRWGESLLSFEQVQKSVSKVRRQLHTMRAALFTVIAGAFALYAVKYGLPYTFQPADWSTPEGAAGNLGWGALTIVLGIITIVSLMASRSLTSARIFQYNR